MGPEIVTAIGSIESGILAVLPLALTEQDYQLTRELVAMHEKLTMLRRDGSTPAETQRRR